MNIKKIANDVKNGMVKTVGVIGDGVMRTFEGPFGVVIMIVYSVLRLTVFSKKAQLIFTIILMNNVLKAATEAIVDGEDDKAKSTDGATVVESEFVD